MLKISILVLLACCLMAAPIAVPEGSSKWTDSRMSLSWLVKGGDVTFVAKLNYYSYFGLLWAHAMQDGDFVIVEETEDLKVQVTDRNLLGLEHGKAVVDAHNDLRDVETDTDGNSYVAVKFTRALKTGDKEDIELNNGPQPICYAMAVGLTRLDRHLKGERRCFDIDLTEGKITNTQVPLEVDANDYGDEPETVSTPVKAPVISGP